MPALTAWRTTYISTIIHLPGLGDCLPLSLRLFLPPEFETTAVAGYYTAAGTSKALTHYRIIRNSLYKPGCPYLGIDLIACSDAAGCKCQVYGKGMLTQNPIDRQTANGNFYRGEKTGPALY